MKQLVLPIKDTNVLHEVEDTLLHNFREGRRNYTIFQVGKATLLRVSDVCWLSDATKSIKLMGTSRKMLIFAIKRPENLIFYTLNQ